MRESFWYFIPLALIILYYVIQSANRFLRWRKTTNLLEFIAFALLLIFMVFGYFNVLNLGFIGGTAVQITYIIIFLVVVLYLLFYSEIKNLLNRHKMKGKERALNTVEYCLLYYCLAKHDPGIINYYHKLGQEPLDNDSIKKFINAISIELEKNGTGPGKEPNEHGLRLKDLSDKIAEIYLSPESE